MMDNPTFSRLNDLFALKSNGQLIRKISVSSNTRPGDVAGYPDSHGYLAVNVDGKKHRVHRVVFCMYYGYWPENSIDHINQTKDDNHPLNLREVSMQCNMRNTGNPANNSSGIKGLSLNSDRQKWYAQIKIRRHPHYLGHFKDFTEAAAHRLAAEQCLGWEGCSTNSPAFLYMELYCGRR